MKYIIIIIVLQICATLRGQTVNDSTIILLKSEKPPLNLVNPKLKTSESDLKNQVNTLASSCKAKLNSEIKFIYFTFEISTSGKTKKIRLISKLRDELKEEINLFTTFLLKKVKWESSYYAKEKSKKCIERHLSLVLDINENNHLSCEIRTQDYGQLIFKYEE